jgi:hypothetical protein
MVAFPEDYKLLVPRLLIETMGAISASFVTRIDTSTDEAASISRASVGGTVFFSQSIEDRSFYLPLSEMYSCFLMDILLLC